MPSTKAATELILKYPEAFKDFEITKGKMDDVFLAVPEKTLQETLKNDCDHTDKEEYQTFFKDKGMFFTSLITPVILLVLYSAFLGEVYRESFTAGIPADADISEGLIDGLVAGQLVSSILAVSCVTVAFCSNFLMVQDKATEI